jgi:hypothetical protein
VAIIFVLFPDRAKDMTEKTTMNLAIDAVTLMNEGYGFVVRDDKSRNMIVSVCYVRHKDAEEARTMMRAALAKAISVTGISGTFDAL